MNILTKLLRREKISDFISTNEGVKAFENLQRDMINLWPQSSFLDADVTNNAVAMTDTGLVAAMEPNCTYVFEAFLTMRSAATGTGIALALSLPAGASISGGFEHNLTLTSKTSSYNIASGVAKGPTSGVPVANEDLPLYARWIVVNGANQGNAVLQFASGVGGSQVLLRGGLCNLNAYQTR